MSKNADQTPLYGLVLAGGSSLRMQKDKGDLQYYGKKQSIFCCEFLSQYCEKVFLSIREDQPQALNFPSIYDKDEFIDIGPLGGILSAMSEYPRSAWLVLACDLPFVDDETLKDLLNNRNAQKVATAYKSVHNGLPEPLCAIYEPLAKGHVEKLFSQGIKCPRKILMNSDIELLDQPNPLALENINTPEEYQKALNSLRSNKS